MEDEKKTFLTARYYGTRGTGGIEDPRRCVVEVTPDNWRFCQCARLRGHGPHGLLCWQHARQYERGDALPIPPKTGGDMQSLSHKERNPL